MPEALETWPVRADGARAAAPPADHLRHQRPLPRSRCRREYPDDADLLATVSLIDESGERRVRMAHLAIVGSHKVNGVSALHTELMRQTIFADFAQAVPRPLQQHDQRHHAAALAGPGQPAAGRPDRPAASAPAGRRTWTQLAALRRVPTTRTSASEFRRAKRQNKKRLAALHRGAN